MPKLSEILFGKKPRTEVTQVSTLSEQQKLLEESLGQFLLGRIGQGLPRFPGELVAPLSEYEQAGLGRLSAFLAPGEAPLGEEQAQSLTRLLEGETPDFFTPERATEFFETAIRRPQVRRFEEETLPVLRESFIGPGSFYSSARVEAERRARRDLEERLAGEEAALQLGFEERRAELRENALDRVGKALQLAPLVTESIRNFPIEQARAAMDLGALPRTLAQAELTAEMDEFIRTLPENNPVINLALNMMGIATTATQFDRTAATKGYLGVGGAFDVGQLQQTVSFGLMGSPPPGETGGRGSAGEQARKQDSGDALAKILTAIMHGASGF